MNTAHHYILSIPLNIDDVDNIPEGVLWEDIQFEEYRITKEDYDNLFHLFCMFDEPFDIIIDEEEEEIIPASGVQTAIEMTENYAANATPEIRTSAEKLLAAFRRAKELGKQVLLSF